MSGGMVRLSRDDKTRFATEIKTASPEELLTVVSFLEDFKERFTPGGLALYELTPRATGRAALEECRTISGLERSGRSPRGLNAYLSRQAPEEGNMDNFSKRLQHLRERRHISRRVLAELCGLSKNTISRYERGERVPSLTDAAAIADALDVSIDFLCGRREK